MSQAVQILEAVRHAAPHLRGWSHSGLDVQKHDVEIAGGDTRDHLGQITTQQLFPPTKRTKNLDKQMSDKVKHLNEDMSLWFSALSVAKPATNSDGKDCTEDCSDRTVLNMVCSEYRLLIYSLTLFSVMV